MLVVKNWPVNVHWFCLAVLNHRPAGAPIVLSKSLHPCEIWTKKKKDWKHEVCNPLARNSGPWGSCGGDMLFLDTELICCWCSCSTWGNRAPVILNFSVLVNKSLIIKFMKNVHHVSWCLILQLFLFLFYLFYISFPFSFRKVKGFLFCDIWTFRRLLVSSFIYLL